MTTLASGGLEGLEAQLLDMLGHNWLMVLMVTTVLWLLITRMAETMESVAKLLGPLGKRIVANHLRRQQRYRMDVAQEAKILAVELLPKVIPADYDAVKVQLKNVITRVEELEQQNQALRGFIIYDEEWHFKEALMYAKLGIQPPKNGHADHISWDVFVERWKSGWRPKDGI